MSTSPPLPAASEVRTILIVDDSAVMLEATTFTLEDAGYRVVTLDNPLMLPGKVRQESPDLILLDVNMPLIRGDDVIGIIRRMGVDVSQSVVLFSDERDLATIAIRVGAAGCISKSATPEELAQQVEHYISRRITRF